MRRNGACCTSWGYAERMSFCASFAFAAALILAGCGDRFVDETGAGGGGGTGGTGEPVCGNSVVEEGEECDDGNSLLDDGCDAGCAFDCRGLGERQDAVGGHCYRKIEKPRTWLDAREKCQELRGGFDLAALSTQPEFAELTMLFAGDYWLGGSDLEVEGIFKWANGELWVYTYNLPPWLATEPSMATGE